MSSFVFLSSIPGRVAAAAIALKPLIVSGISARSFAMCREMFEVVAL